MTSFCWFRRYFGRLHNRAWAQDLTFPFDLVDYEQRHETLAQSSLAMHRNDWINQDELGSGAFREALEALARDEPIEVVLRENPQLRHTINFIKTVGGRVRGSPQERARFQHTIKALTTCKGNFSVWFTLNLSELSDPHVLLFMGERSEHMCRIPLSQQQMKAARRRHNTLVAKDPYAVADWFDYFARAVFEHLFGYRLPNGTGNPGKFLRRGLLGTVDAAVGCKECAQRGGLHGHFGIWVRELIGVRRLAEDSATCKVFETRLAALVDSMASTEVHAVPSTWRGLSKPDFMRDDVQVKVPATEPGERARVVVLASPLDNVRALNVDPRAMGAPATERRLGEAVSAVPFTSDRGPNAPAPTPADVQGLLCPSEADVTRYLEDKYGGDWDSQDEEERREHAVASLTVDLASEAAYGREWRERALDSLDPAVDDPEKAGKTEGYTPRGSAKHKLCAWDQEGLLHLGATVSGSLLHGQAQLSAPPLVGTDCSEHADEWLSVCGGPATAANRLKGGFRGACCATALKHGEANCGAKRCQNAKPRKATIKRRCHVGCFKSSYAREKRMCRFRYGENGKLLATITQFKDDGTLSTKRNIAHVVSHSKSGTFVLRCKFLSCMPRRQKLYLACVCCLTARCVVRRQQLFGVRVFGRRSQRHCPVHHQLHDEVRAHVAQHVHDLVRGPTEARRARGRRAFSRRRAHEYHDRSLCHGVAGRCFLGGRNSGQSVRVCVRESGLRCDAALTTRRVVAATRRARWTCRGLSWLL